MELDPAGAATVLHALDAAEARDGLPHIDAVERRRLVALAAGRSASARPDWTARRLDGWYLGLRVRPDGGAIGEAGRLDHGPVAPALVLADGAGAARVWLRGAMSMDVAAAAAAGWDVRRELLVLGRALGAVDRPAPDPPVGLRLAPLAEVGPDAVAGLLERAYAGARREGLIEEDPEAGAWTRERFVALATVALADAADLLLAVDRSGRLAGVHWTGRRAGDVGEVFNLAVDPARAGQGIGAWLLAAGLAHLAGLGRREAVLWVDAANAPARALYSRAGFVVRGRDVALGR